MPIGKAHAAKTHRISVRLPPRQRGRSALRLSGPHMGSKQAA
jgi:hypothetical protein